MKKDKIKNPLGDKLSPLNWFNICLFNLIGGIAWNLENMYFNTFLYSSVYAGASAEALAGSMSPITAISRMVSLSAITAVATTFIMGTFSDRMKNRKVFISFGYILWGLVTALFGFITRDNIAGIFNLSDGVQILTFTVWTVIIMDMVMTFMGSTSNDSAFNAWVTDITSPTTRPKVETAFTFIGFIAMGIVMGVGSAAQGGVITYKAFFGVLGLAVAACGIIGLFTLKEPEHISAPSKNESFKERIKCYLADLFYGFKPSVIKENSRLYLILASIGVFNSAFQVFFPYLFVYLQYVVLKDAKTMALMDPLSPVLIIVAVLAIAVLIAGVVILMKLSAKNKFLGFIPGAICLVVGLLIFSTSTDIITILVGLAPTFIGYLVLTIQLNAAIRDFTPPEKTGLFQGIRMIFVVLIPMVVGPKIGEIACKSAAASYINEYGVETLVPDAKMFLYSAVVALLVFIPLLILRKKGIEKTEE